MFEALSAQKAGPDAASFPGISEIVPIEGRAARPLKVCIASEDIVGPIRNGGIGTTYTHLAFLLAGDGHDVTILYPRGSHSEKESIAHWIAWYRDRGIRFVPLALPQDIDQPASRWLKPMVALYEALKAEHFDLVHVSEWRASAYYCLLAKRHGLAFQNTLFCVKASSPYLWNREHMLEPIDDPTQLVKIYAERRSIELADIVIGGSHHLLIWMLEHGYRLPEGRSYVQPNVAIPVDIDADLRRDRPPAGTRVRIEEIVFFGRLEGRKGLDIFCEAIHRLAISGVRLPKITFLGKYGARIPTHPELSIANYIAAQASTWGVDWKIVDNYGQAEAISYLHGKGRLAVMPSVIENSSLTVYETTHFHIPFVASDRGGNPELVAAEHRDSVLAPPHPVPLSEKLAEAIEKGGFVAAPSFDNDANLAVWRKFHSNIATVIDAARDADGHSLEFRAANEFTGTIMHRVGAAAGAAGTVSISVCLVLHDNHEALEATLNNIVEQRESVAEVLVVNDGSESEPTLAWLKRQKDSFAFRGWRIFDRSHYGVADARNFAAANASGSHLLFIDAGARLSASALSVLAQAARGADVLVAFFNRPSDRRGTSSDAMRRFVSIAGDTAYAFFDPPMTNPLLLVRKLAFDHIGGLTTDYKIAGETAEFLASATLAGFAVETIPEVLATQAPSGSAAEGTNDRAAPIRCMRPFFARAEPYFQPLLYAVVGLNTDHKTAEGNFRRVGAPKGLAGRPYFQPLLYAAGGLVERNRQSRTAEFAQLWSVLLNDVGQIIQAILARLPRFVIAILRAFRRFLRVICRSLVRPVCGIFRRLKMAVSIMIIPKRYLQIHLMNEHIRKLEADNRRLQSLVARKLLHREETGKVAESK